ncbi:MAG: FISUMP domain-containing protein [Saprospiraceae bacterium]
MVKVIKYLVPTIIALNYFFACKSASDELCKHFYSEIIQDGPNLLRAIGYGTPPYTYEWSTGVHLTELSVSQAGIYSVVVTDFNLCSSRAEFSYSPGSCDTAGIYDDDKNFYKVITIGDQCWLQSNLKSRSGFPEVKDSVTWSKTTSPAWCYFKYDSNFATYYGKLYNGYAVESGKLCTKGWHVPTDAEWTKLIDNLGGVNVAGEKMKSTTSLWENPSVSNDSSGFGIFPGGRVQLNGSFLHQGQQAGFWSSTLIAPGSNEYYYRGFANSLKSVFKISWSKGYGFSCRCIKN